MSNWSDFKKYLAEMEGREVQVHYKRVNPVGVPTADQQGVNFIFPGPSGKVTRVFETFFELRTSNGPMAVTYDAIGALFFPSEISAASGMPGPGFGGLTQ